MFPTLATSWHEWCTEYCRTCSEKQHWILLSWVSGTLNGLEEDFMFCEERNHAGLLPAPVILTAYN